MEVKELRINENCYIASNQVSVVSFAVFVLIDRNNVLDANIAFVSLSLFGILGVPLTMVPNLITQFVMVSKTLLFYDLKKSR